MTDKHCEIWLKASLLCDFEHVDAMFVFVSVAFLSFVHSVINRDAIVIMSGKEIYEGDASGDFVFIAAPVEINEFVMRRPAFVQGRVIDDERAFHVHLRLHMLPEILGFDGLCCKPARDGIVSRCILDCLKRF